MFTTENSALRCTTKLHNDLQSNLKLVTFTKQFLCIASSTQMVRLTCFQRKLSKIITVWNRAHNLNYLRESIKFWDIFFLLWNSMLISWLSWCISAEVTKTSKHILFKWRQNAVTASFNLLGFFFCFSQLLVPDCNDTDIVDLENSLMNPRH